MDGSLYFTTFLQILIVFYHIEKVCAHSIINVCYIKDLKLINNLAAIRIMQKTIWCQNRASVLLISF